MDTHAVKRHRVVLFWTIACEAAMRAKALFSRKANAADIPLMNWSTFLMSGIEDSLEEAPYQPEQCCMIVHTGGTTGSPKGVMLSNENVNAAFHQVFHSPITMERGDVFLNIMPPFIAYGMVLGIHTALSWGWKSVLIPKFNATKFDVLLMKHKPNGLIAVPSYR